MGRKTTQAKGAGQKKERSSVQESHYLKVMRAQRLAIEPFLGDLMNPRQGPDQPVRMHTMASIATDGTQYITLTERIPPSEAGAEPVLRTTISWGHTSFFPRGARIPTTEVMEDIPEEDEETWQDDAIDEDEPAPRRSSQPRRRPTVQRRGPSPSVAAEARAARAARRQNRRQTRATVVDEPEPEPEQPVASGSGSNRRGQRVPTSELGADLIDGLHKLGVESDARSTSTRISTRSTPIYAPSC